jgi:hydrogenase 3 maturation protease
MFGPDQNKRLPRLSMIGVGYELGGDDAVGVHVVRRLQRILPKTNDLQLVIGGSAPENVAGQIRRFDPEHVLLFDAAEFGGQPGDIAFLDWKLTSGFSASTHTLPLHVFAGYLQDQFHCPVHLLGIQPADLSFDAPLSPPVEEAAQRIVTGLERILCS